MAGMGSAWTISEASVKTALKFFIKVVLDGMLFDVFHEFLFASRSCLDLGTGNRGGAGELGPFISISSRSYREVHSQPLETNF